MMKKGSCVVDVNDVDVKKKKVQLTLETLIYSEVENWRKTMEMESEEDEWHEWATWSDCCGQKLWLSNTTLQLQSL